MINGGLVRLPVKDVGASVRFYVETLGMKLVEEAEGNAVIDCGDGFLLSLTQAERAVVLKTKMTMDESKAILANRGVAVDERNRFVDPDGNVFHLVPRA